MLNKLKSLVKRYYDPHDIFIQKLRKDGASVGKYVQIVDGKRFLYEPWCSKLIEIHDEVVIAAGVRLVSHDSSYANLFENVPTKYGKIVIGKNVYIGVNAIILPGITIGESSLIGAGTLVNKDIPPRSVVVGNPCRVIGTVDDGLQKYLNAIAANENELVDYIDLGGSYAHMLKVHGKNVNYAIVKKFAEFYSNK